MIILLSISKSGLDLVIDKEETCGRDFEIADTSIRALLVRKNSSAGAVRVFGQPIMNVVTDPKERGYTLVVVASGEDCMFLGSPSVRCFRIRTL